MGSKVSTRVAKERCRQKEGGIHVVGGGGFRTDGVGGREFELKAVDLILVEGVWVEHPYVEEPFFKVVGRHQLDSGREIVVQLDVVHPSPLTSLGPS